jgi:hypothetical protein
MPGEGVGGLPGQNPGTLTKRQLPVERHVPPPLGERLDALYEKGGGKEKYVEAAAARHSAAGLALHKTISENRGRGSRGLIRGTRDGVGKGSREKEEEWSDDLHDWCMRLMVAEQWRRWASCGLDRWIKEWSAWLDGYLGPWNKDEEWSYIVIHTRMGEGVRPIATTASTSNQAE